MLKKSPLLVVFITIFMDLVGFGIVIPLLPFYAKHMGASGFKVGLLISVYSAAQFVLSPLIGRLSDRVGRRPVLLFTVATNVVGYTLFGLAHSYGMLMFSRMISGIGGSNLSVAQAAIADSTTPENRAKGMGLIGAAFGLGFTLGPAIGGFLGKFDYAWPGFFAAGLCLINLCLASFIFPETLPLEKRSAQVRLSRWQMFRKTVRKPDTALYIFLFFMVTLAFSQMEATFSLFASARFHLSVMRVGYLFTMVGVIVGLMQGGAIGFLSKKFGETRLLTTGLTGLATALALMSLSSTVMQLVVVVAMMAMFNALNNPSLMSLLSKSAAADVQGGVMGVGQSGSALARILGPMIGGFCFDHLGVGSPYAVAALIIVLALGTLLFFSNRDASRGAILAA